MTLKCFFLSVFVSKNALKVASLLNTRRRVLLHPPKITPNRTKQGNLYDSCPQTSEKWTNALILILPKSGK